MNELSHGKKLRRARLVSFSLAVALLLAALPALAAPSLPLDRQAVAVGHQFLSGSSPELKLNQPIGTTQDRFGNIYIADTGNNRIVKVDAAGRLQLEVGATGPARARLNLPSDVAVDRQGFIYVADTMNHRVVKYDAQGRFKAAWDGLHGPSGLALGPDRFLYVADTLAHRIVKMSRGGKTVATWGHEGSGDGELRFPRDVAVRPSGVYVTDMVNHRVVKFSAQGEFIKSWGSFGSGPGQFNHPWGLTVDADDNLWVADLSNHRIQRISQKEAGVLVVKATAELIDSEDPTIGEWYGDEMKTITYSTEVSLATATAGSLDERQATAGLRFIVARSGSNRVDVLRIDPAVSEPYESAPLARRTITAQPMPLHAQQRVTTLAASDNIISAGTGTSLQYPIGVRMGADGLTYIADTGNSRIVVVDSRGRLVRTWGGFGSAPGQLNLPADLVLDSAGNVLVADTMNNRVQKFTARGELLATWGSEDLFRAPHGIAIADDGSVFVADTLGHRITHFTAEGTLLGAWGGQGSGPGEMSFPHGLAVDGGFLYVADFMNHRITKFTFDGAPVESWGEFGEDPAQFRHPWGVAVGPDHSVWVSDMSNSRIQRFSEFGSLLGIYGSYGSGLGQFDHPKAIDVNAAGQVAVGVAGLHAVDLFTAESDR